MTNVVLTVIGDDRPGLVSALSEALANHGGNWLDGRLTRLAGKFAGVVLAEVPAEQVHGFEAAVGRFNDLHVTVTPSEATTAQGRRFSLHLIGNDQPGIVHEVSRTLAAQHVSIDSIETSTSEAPMGGGTLFHTDAVIRAGEDVDLDAVARALEAIAGELMVDLDFDPAP